MAKHSHHTNLSTIVLVLLFSLFVIVNIYFSQSVNPLYFQVINEDRRATITFLKKIKELPDFENNYFMNTQIFGEEIQRDLFSENEKRVKRITELESLLKINPKSRDVLYGLSVLYRNNGDTEKADYYLEKAKQIDPLVGK
jgi:tetratricopeptide (TPR) repeat protein